MILHERPLGWGESSVMSNIKITITEKKEESALSIVMACIVSIINMFLGAWVFSVLWGWFINPLGFPRLTLFWSMGILATVELALLLGSPAREMPQPQLGRNIGMTITILVTFPLGWAIHLLA